MTAVVIGVGNEYRRDDGVGPAVAARVTSLHVPDVRVVFTDGDPARLLDAWTSMTVAVIVDAVVVRDPSPGRVHRLTIGGLPEGSTANSSHGLGIPEAVELGRALDRLPGRLVFYTVEISETSYGIGLSSPITAAVDTVTTAVLRELSSA